MSAHPPAAVPAPPLTPAAPPAAAPRPPGVWRLALRQLLRDARAGELRLLVVAVLLAVAALTAVGFFADRLNRGLERDARQLLGGDAVISSDRPAPEAVRELARRLGLVSAQSISFPSMARATEAQGGEARLVSVKAVEPSYPLRGTLSLRRSAGGAAQAEARAPAPGTVWVDPALLDGLQLRLGDTLLLGDARLQVAAVIETEPDRGAGFSTFAPRLMLAAADLPATGLVQAGSRVGYRLALAAPATLGLAEGDRRVADFVRQTEGLIASEGLRGLRLESVESGRPEMKQTLDRAQKFLNLVALLAALLAAVAVGIAARDFASRHLDDCAMLRVLGLSQRAIAGAYALEFFAVGLLASALGVLIGLLVHQVFVVLLAGLVSAALPPPGPLPALFGLGVGLTLLMGFGLPPVLQLARVPPLRVLRRDVGGLKAASLGVLAAGALGFSALLLAVAADVKLGAIAVGGFAVAIAVFAVLAYAAVTVLRRAVPEARAPRALLLATRQLAARPAFAVLQVSALAVGLLALMLLVLLRTDLVSSWRQASPPDAPNRFVINLQPDQAADFQATLKAAGVAGYDWYPMIRGRLVAINGQAVGPESYRDDRAQRLVDREFNLSHSAQLPGHNRVSAGRWTADEAEGLSVEDGLAKTLGLKLGDRLRFDIGGQLRESRITSLRRVDWGSMRVNFFVIYPQAEMPDVPATYISAFRAPAQGAAALDRELSRRFPNLTNIDVTATIAQVQGVLDQVIRAVEFLFGFTLVAGLVVLFAAVAATRESRAREFAVMRALGAGSRLLAQVQRFELLGVGALSGALASVAALAVGWALARWVFEFTWQPLWWLPLPGALLGATLAWAAGWFSLRSVLQRPVAQTLRQAAD